MIRPQRVDAAGIQSRRRLRARGAARESRFARWLLSCIVAIWLATAPFAHAIASPETTGRPPVETIQRLFTTPADAADLFSPAVREKTSPKQLSNVAQSLLDKYGDFQSVVSFDRSYVIDLKKARVYARVVFDPNGLITGFRVIRLVPKFFSLNQVRAAFAKLPGTVSFVVEKDGKDLLAAQPDAKLAVGSSFKLAVLNALLDEIKAGHLSWNQDVILKANWRALPTGILQAWPPGMNLTVQTLAGLMISLSDNTATDAIMSLLSPQAMQKYAGENQPLLTPRQFFVLAGYQARALREKFIKSDLQERVAMLSAIDSQLLPDLGEIEGADSKAIGWHFSVHDLCRLIGRAHDALPLQINPGLAIPQYWSAVAFKGGDDVGVLNLTTWLKNKKNSTYCVSATWNNEGELNNMQLEQPYTALIALLRDTSP